ncbi:hypothetical protein PMM47T1_27067 [Pseudomonas sp. M47T1]|uniref:hypothetical protein n=1 Tax=Pseudomonas sp. M47T1 TaxID=1179778 RepID=UPI000260865B|nr:hypothetical protein [Pseudomonas sp. M47T1]EIK93427.1 hypothetical protein PMM47T1_27067 [Pseudomonas sp. M47T1]
MPDSPDDFELVIQLPPHVHFKLTKDARASERSVAEELTSQLERAGGRGKTGQRHDQFIAQLREALQRAALGSMALDGDIEVTKRDRSSDH